MRRIAILLLIVGAVVASCSMPNVAPHKLAAVAASMAVVQRR